MVTVSVKLDFSKSVMIVENVLLISIMILRLNPANATPATI